MESCSEDTVASRAPFKAYACSNHVIHENMWSPWRLLSERSINRSWGTINIRNDSQRIGCASSRTSNVTSNWIEWFPSLKSYSMKFHINVSRRGMNVARLWKRWLDQTTMSVCLSRSIREYTGRILPFAFVSSTREGHIWKLNPNIREFVVKVRFNNTAVATTQCVDGLVRGLTLFMYVCLSVDSSVV